jgi:hypothetical protein
MRLMMKRGHEWLRIVPGKAERLECSTNRPELANPLCGDAGCRRVSRTLGQKFSIFIGYDA